jgi:uncharacterized protein involved in cysteine biosynthesis
MDTLVLIIVSLGVAVATALALTVAAIVAAPFVSVIAAIRSRRAQPSEVIALLPAPAPVEPDHAVEALKADLKRQFAIEQMRAQRGY